MNERWKSQAFSKAVTPPPRVVRDGPACVGAAARRVADACRGVQGRLDATPLGGGVVWVRRRLGPRIALAHAKDVVPPPGGASHCRYAPAGQGRLDYATYLRLLQESGYANGVILHSLSEREIPGCVAQLRAHAPDRTARSTGE